MCSSDLLRMTSTTVLLAKEKGAKLYKEGKFSESIGSYSVAIENTDSNDPELHLYYRCAHKIIPVTLLILQGRIFLINQTQLILTDNPCKQP